MQLKTTRTKKRLEGVDNHNRMQAWRSLRQVAENGIRLKGDTFLVPPFRRLVGCGCFRRFRSAQPTVSIVAAFQADDGFGVVANARNF